MNLMTIDEAYNIAGGFVESDQATFEKAIKLIEEHDKEIAQILIEARNYEKLSKQKHADNERLSVSAEVLAKNTEFLYNKLDNNDFEKSLLEDEEVSLAINNTPVIDNNGDNVYELSQEEKEKYISMLVEKTKLDVMCEQSKSSEFSELTDDKKIEYLKKEIKTSFLGSLMHLRTAAQIADNVPNAEKALTEDNEEFFQNQQLALGNMELQDKAADFNQKVKVHADIVIASCAETEYNAGKYAHKLSVLSAAAKSENAKSFLNKASNFISRAKESFSQKAKQIWGQRYEFANNMRDRAPKTITDIAAVSGLIGATAIGAPWLGTAVVAYGAYKVASSWVWPIITKARRDARLSKNNPKDKKTTFMERLKKASNSIFSNKESRKEYFKEAGWGSAAGLIGLGAAGAVVSGTFGATGAIAARGAQRLASLAVSSVHGATNTIATLKNKNKDFWDKALAVVGFGAASAFIAYAALDTDTETNTQANMPATSTPEPVEAHETTSLTENNETTVETVTEDVVPKTVQAPSDWSKESGITRNQWNRLQTFWGGPEKYQEYYSRITDDMLQSGGAFEGMTRDEVLFKYERMSSWNLWQHHDDIKKFDSFFECKTLSTLTYQDGLVLDSVMDDGSILGVEGKMNTIVTSREINCGGENTLSTVTVENKTVFEPVAKIVSEPEDVVPTPYSEVQVGFDTTAGQTITIEDVKQYNVDIYQSNNLDDGKLVGSWGSDDITLNTENREIVINTNAENLSHSGNVEAHDSSASIYDNSGSVVNTSMTENLDNAVTQSDVASNNFINNSSNIEDNVYSSTQLNNVSNTLEEATYTETHVTSYASDVALDWDNAEVVPDSKDVEIGTPAAGNVEERGGYNNSGITQRQFDAMQTFFKDRYGDNAYDFFSSMITDEMRAKGGIFEGLSVEQSMFSVKQMVAWSNDQHGEFSKEITATINYLKGCSEDISPEMAPHVKEVIDRVNENGTIDGVTGTKNVVVRYFQAGDCGEAGTYSIERTTSGVTVPSTDSFDRLYLRPLPVVSEKPVQIGFDIVDGNEYEITEEREFTVDIIKSNNLNDGTVISENVSPNDIDANVETRSIVIDRKGTQAPFNPNQNQR